MPEQIQANETETLKAEIAKAEPNPRVAYVEDAPAEELNESGLLICLPGHYDETRHKMPRGKHFADPADYHEFRANITELKIQALQEQAASDRAAAERMRKFGDPDTRARISKFQKQLDALSKLKKELEASGADTSDFDLEALLGR